MTFPEGFDVRSKRKVRLLMMMNINQSQYLRSIIVPVEKCQTVRMISVCWATTVVRCLFVLWSGFHTLINIHDLRRRDQR